WLSQVVYGRGAGRGPDLSVGRRRWTGSGDPGVVLRGRPCRGPSLAWFRSRSPWRWRPAAPEISVRTALLRVWRGQGRPVAGRPGPAGARGPRPPAAAARKPVGP